jgi:NAD(P)-dependent dehydrogenase (short-subunit alcohol dehydrogenase family)
MFRLDRKVAIITGGGSGIGRAIAKVFAGQGASVFVLDMDQEAGNSVVKEILQEKGKAEFRKCDVADQTAATGVVENIFAQGGSIDILVNNAGIAHIGTAESTSEADFERLIRVNIKGVYNCIKAAIPHMKKNGGTILNMASAAATVGIPERFGYSMTKGAVLSMTLSVAKDYVNQNIRCNCISPGRVHTPFVDGFITKNYPGREKEMFEKLSKTQPIGRMAQPEEIAYLALYLCSEEAAFVTGCDYPIDGGFIRLNN